MRVLVCGDRNFCDRTLMRIILDEHTITELIEGEARGADTLARVYAEERGIPVRKFPAEWDRYGRGAGPIRNAQMLEEGKPELVIAFLAQHSRGTRNMVMQAQKLGVPVRIVEI